eukprot:m.284286 g.284286  ORF g.284286 m.284286 type:complete len:447 (+) comp19903_c0_seq2:192-1532(+)
MSPSLYCPVGTNSYQLTQPNSGDSSGNPQSKCTLLKAGLKCKHKATYASLIAMAIYSSPNKRLMLHQIYAFVDAHRLLVPAAVHPNWKNSVRHNLSLRSCFRKVPRWALDGKKLSAYWELDMESLPPAAAAAVSELKTHGLMQFPFDQYVSEESSDHGEEDAEDNSTPSANSRKLAWVGSNPRSMQQIATTIPHAVRRWTATPEISEEDTDDESHGTAALHAAAQRQQQHMAWVYGRSQFAPPPNHPAAMHHQHQQHMHLVQPQHAINPFYYGPRPPPMHPMYAGHPSFPAGPPSYPAASHAMMHHAQIASRPANLHPGVHGGIHHPVHSGYMHPLRSASEPAFGRADNDAYTPPRSPASLRRSTTVAGKSQKLKKRPSPKPVRTQIQHDETDDDDDTVLVVRPKSSKKRTSSNAGKSDVRRSKSEDSTDSLLGILAHAATIIDTN